MAYLTHSPYGRNRNEITINNSSDYITGNAGNSVSASYAPGTTNAYNTTAGMLASTTGNITGIYDMSGGAYDCVAAWEKNSTSSDISNNGSSFASKGGSSTKYATAYNGDSSSEPSSSRCIVGDATYEVYVGSYSAWFKDSSNCVKSLYPFFARGGAYINVASTGSFAAGAYSGGAGSFNSFRLCLPRGVGLELSRTPSPFNRHLCIYNSSPKYGKRFKYIYTKEKETFSGKQLILQ